jgi:hypothetical protein
MSKTIHVDMSKWAGTDVTGPITLTYDGATPADPGPSGTVARMLEAQVSNDTEGMKASVTEATLKMGRPTVPGKDLVAHIGAATADGDRHVVPCKMSADGNEQEIAFVVVTENGGLRVDMNATIERMMGVSMTDLGAMMEEGMKQMAEGMSTAMQGLGEGIAEAFGASEPAEQSPRDLVPAHPDLAGFRQEIIDMLGVRWNVDAEWDSFGASEQALGESNGLLAEPLHHAVQGVERLAKGGGSRITQLDAVEEFRVRANPGGRSMVERDGRRVTYSIAQDDDGRLTAMDPSEFGRALARELEGILS